MPTDSELKKILHGNKLAPSRQRGQNFLVNPKISEAIVRCSGVSLDDIVIELGVGFGSLTLPLAEKVKQVIGLEIDAGIVQWHEQEQVLPQNVLLRHEDLLKADFTELAGQIPGGRLKILANLPYSISNPLLFKLIENRNIIDSATLMLQKEVGCRLAASPSSKEYGVLTVLLNSCAVTSVVMEVGPEQFHPRPKVDSVVVHIAFVPVPARVKSLPSYDFDMLKRLVKASFQQRRKTLLNSISASGIHGTGRAQLSAVFARAGIDPKIRPEQLTVEDFVALTREVSPTTDSSSEMSCP
ncbi:MAG: ribosomal RNA small subunit methyltransferase A [Proteobacteria bacterium]|nr:ribosomal RNA small subunit methyltransferase A [Pseudomonadota bacterium]MBU1686507.1 ribosomal RNA small subunit methyltransferase A [Pseudomonadota bacterium]